MVFSGSGSDSDSGVGAGEGVSRIEEKLGCWWYLSLERSIAGTIAV